ncbi:hypothetical protein NQ317_000411 [Molorchus minor]|uniref:Uncharacterized protein n=1 Tax=Molorchus minor TaxID=1323400 RepID=A0ABQ9JB61_9CUCU|nr:hypothetical protein NQ317_000411 [Molorchus minor]
MLLLIAFGSREIAKDLALNLNVSKNHFDPKTKTTYYTITQKEDSDCYDNDFLSPRAYSMTTFSMDYNAVNENIGVVSYVPPSMTSKMLWIDLLGDEQTGRKLTED